MRKHRKAIAAGVLAAVLTAGAVGWALWSVSGSGEAYSKASQSQALTTVDVSATITGDLYPGGSGGISVKFANPNVFPVTVTKVFFGAVTPSTCAVTTDADSGTVSISVPAGGESATAVFPNAAHMGAGAGDACQNQVFTIAVPTVTAAQS